MSIVDRTDAWNTEVSARFRGVNSIWLLRMANVISCKQCVITVQAEMQGECRKRISCCHKMRVFGRISI